MKKRNATLLCLLLLSTQAFAETPEVTLPEVVSTASRWEEPSKDVPQDMVVISRSEIEKKGVTFVTDLLRTQPDLQIIQNGGPGTQATLLMRGGDSSQVLVLVDGIKINNPTTGSADLSFLLTTDVERIEIIKGPQSTLYGSEAMAGVVNIITKKGSGAFKGDLSVEGGSFNTVKTSGNISGGSERLNYRLSANYFDTDGIPIAKGGSVPNGYSNKSASTRIGVNPTDNSSIELNMRYGYDKNQLDHYNYGTGSMVDTRNYNQDHENYLISATGKVLLWDKYEQSLSLSYLSDDIKATDPDPTYTYNNYRIKTAAELLDWQHTVEVKPLKLTGGFSYRYETANNEGSFNNSIDNKAGYLNAKLNLLEDTLILNAGGRYDHHSMFGDAFTYRAGLLYSFNPLEMRFKANVASGFRAPSLNELYYPYYGNPGLKPEKSTGYDIGLEKDLFDKKLVLGATWFYQHYRNLIQTNFATFTADNIGKARAEGVELKATAQVLDNLRLNAAYTWLDAIDEDNGTVLSLRPKSKVTSSVDYAIAKLNVIGEYQYVSSRHDSSSGRDIGGYSLVNLRGSYALNRNLSLFARIDNLFDKKYEEIAGYGTPGLSVFGGVKATF